MYRLVENSGVVVRLEDGAAIPDDPRNPDRRIYAAWIAAGGVPEPAGPPRDLAAAKAEKLAALAALRFARETAGIGGFRTDRESQALLTGAALAATLDPDYTVDWKGEAGWVTLDAVQLLGAAQTVRGHVQACFSNERAHAAAIAALTTIADVDAYDILTGWP